MAQQANHPLPAGFQLDAYRIEGQLSLGGFSIVYRATDGEGQCVAVKEYLPNSLALRGEGETRPVVRSEHLPAFRYGMRCFFEEGRALAALSHPNVVRVRNFFRANDTVYIVMDYEKGRTLQEIIHNNPEALTENFMRKVFTRLLNGLREVHAHKLLHLDIKPSNIYLRNDRTPLLIDFGAARQTLARDTPMLKPMFTPGFASPEHHARRERLGPWSDIYSVGAAMYACLAACIPPSAEARGENDNLAPAAERWHGRYSAQLLETIDWCLRLDPLQRPQSVFALQKALTAKVAGSHASTTGASGKDAFGQAVGELRRAPQAE